MTLAILEVSVERNLVLTRWERTDEMGKTHDEASTDRRNPTVNANGPIYGVDIANDNLSHPANRNRGVDRVAEDWRRMSEAIRRDVLRSRLTGYGVS